MPNKKLYNTLNAIQEAVFILDSERHIVFVNQVGEKLFGKGFEGKDFVQVLRSPEILDSINEVYAGKRSASKVVAIDYPIRSHFSLMVRKVKGKLIVVSLKDISDMREAEKMRSDFVANVSHELRSPLTTLVGFIETLQGPAKGDEKANERFLELMNHEASRMTRLIADLLSLSKVEANLRVRPREKINVLSIIQRIKSNLEEQAKLANTSIEVNFGDVKPTVIGNEDELTQVFQNLIENAIKYGDPNKSVKIWANIFESVPNIEGRALCVVVEDEGEGIPKEHLSRLTERFYRVDTHRSRNMGGTGLGLSIVKHIINRHRGSLQIDSEIGVGSKFSVYLPTGK
ncbi:MAG: ATP-binding protein [Nitratireductor sp.]